MKMIILRHILSHKVNKRRLIAFNIGFLALGLFIYLMDDNVMNIIVAVGFSLFLTAMVMISEYISITDGVIYPGPLSLLKIKHGEITHRLNEISFLDINDIERSKLNLLSEDYDNVIEIIEKQKASEDKKHDM